MTTAERLRQAIAAWDRASETYASFGAADTEPEGVFQCLLVRAFRGEDVTVPSGGRGWQLYSSMNCRDAAAALELTAQQAVNIIQDCPVRELKEIKPVLSDYCWRVGI